MCTQPIGEREGYLAELRSALAHLDDPPYLERHPLTSRLSFIAQAPDLSRGQALRRALRVAIAALDPGDSSATARLGARSYQVLYQWAICRQSTVAIADLLGISRRQTYRELQHAIEALGQVLSGTLAGTAPQEPPIADQSQFVRAPQVHDELERLGRVTDQDVELGQLLTGVVQSARYLARDRGTEIDLHVATPGLHIAANRVMLRQAILNLVSHIIAVNERGQVAVRLDRSGPQAKVQLAYRPAQSTDELVGPNSPYGLAVALFESLGVEWTQSQADDGTVKACILIPLVRERTVLVVDDNEGVIALFRRYLRSHPYRVYGAGSADEALARIESLWPEVVILDVMMPDRDGWELLQMLRAGEAGRQARIIVCSIVNDPKLATALGADGFLNKPVDQASLLQALAALPTSTV